MLTHSWWFLLVDALAVYRLAILVAKDKITDRPRNILMNLGYSHAKPRRGIRGTTARWLFELVTCPWCVSLWFAAGAVALTRFYPDEWQYAAMWLALSGVTGFLAER